MFRVFLAAHRIDGEREDDRLRISSELCTASPERLRAGDFAHQMTIDRRHRYSPAAFAR